ncbi:MAG: hypothetical protein U0271_19425 [Polyangiaceae bacterium]
MSSRASSSVWVIASAALALGLAACDGGSDDGGPGGSGGGGGSPTADVTFHKDVEPLLQRSCLGCHYDGKIGGFSLVTYDDAKPMADFMASMTEARLMPPWGAQETDDCKPRLPWRNDLRLSDEEIAMLRAWADAGAPEGNPADAPPAYVPPPDGLPNADIELTPAEPSMVSGNTDQFICVVYDPQLTEDKWVDGINILADNTKVAHHAVTFRANRADVLAESGGAERYPCFGGTQGDVVHVWAPGGQPFELPDDVGIKLTPDQVIVVQMHYHPRGDTVEQDSSKLQLRFRDQVPSYQLLVTFPGNAKDASEGLLPDPDDRTADPEFRIPAGSTDHVETMEIRVPNEVIIDVPILMVMPHMHYVGTDIRLDIERATQPPSQPQNECLVQTPAWDFSWQRFYTYDVPINELPTGKAGDVFKVTCHYNNSSGNPYVAQALEEQGLSAPVDVYLGEQTLDEMCLVPLGILLPSSLNL